MNKLRAILTFYSSFAVASFVITLTCIIFTYIAGVDFFTILFWFKIASMILFFFFIREYKRKEFYYYLNLGLSIKFLWITTLLLDLLLFLSLMITTLIVR